MIGLSTTLQAHEIDLAWTQGVQPSGETVANTQIIRNGSMLAIVGSAILSYADVTVTQGQSYSYALINVDTNGMLSSPTMIVSATVPPDASPQYQFSVSPASLGFSGTVGGVNPGPLTISVGDTGPSGYHVPITVQSDASWLTVVSNSPQTAATLTVAANLSGLNATPPVGHIIITGGVTNSPFSVPVTFALAQPPPPVIISVTCSTATSPSCKITNMKSGQTVGVQITDPVTGKTIASTTAHRN